jgi:hypothetical protein
VPTLMVVMPEARIGGLGVGCMTCMGVTRGEMFGWREVGGGMAVDATV